MDHRSIRAHGRNQQNNRPRHASTGRFRGRGLAAVISAAVLATTLSPLGAGVALAAPFTTDDLTGGSPTATMLADNLAGTGVTVSNVTYTGAENAAGTFAGGTGIIDFDSGIVLSSGDIANIIGPNVNDGTSVNNGTAGDADLNLLTTSTTNDAAILEFDFVPNANKVFFSYVFGSEEYNEYVNTTFNDVFGFFVTAAGSTTKVNCATVADGPDAGTDPDPVTINSINNGDPFGTSPNSHPELYRNNDPNDPAATIDTSMDGLTVTLVCEATVVAGQPNRLKLAIADTSDRILDSYVLLKTASLSTGLPVPTIATATSADITLGAGTLSDTATVSGRVNPIAGATVSFRLYGPNDATCTGAAAFESLDVPLPVADGPVSSAAFTPTLPGTYRWIASYSGDANNAAVSGACNDPNETVTVLPAPTELFILPNTGSQTTLLLLSAALLTLTGLGLARVSRRQAVWR